jgi:hypothetical protein
LGTPAASVCNHGTGGVVEGPLPERRRAMARPLHRSAWHESGQDMEAEGLIDFSRTARAGATMAQFSVVVGN